MNGKERQTLKEWINQLKISKRAKNGVMNAIPYLLIHDCDYCNYSTLLALRNIGPKTAKEIKSYFLDK